MFPAVLPVLVTSPVTLGAPAEVKVNWLDEEEAEVPVGVVTVMFTMPLALGGAIAVREVSELTVKLLAAAVPKLTAVAPVKLVPVRVMLVPPAVLPLLVLSPVTVEVLAEM